MRAIINIDIKYANRLNKFREAILGDDGGARADELSVLIITHDYPDPDCISSAYGLCELLKFWGMKSPVISFGGFVGRAENRAMIRYVNIPTLPFPLIDAEDYDRIILVDCYPGKGNVSLPSSVPVHAVIDHHPNTAPADAPFFHDIRPEYGAAATIVAQYLLESGCPMSPKLATALFNGIKTDTGGMQRPFIDADIECYKLLFERMDHKLLSEIEFPGRDVEFFRTLHRASEAAVCFDDVGYSHLGTVSTPDSVAEMAEFFHCWEKVEWMICTGIFKNQIFFSIRSEIEETAGIKAERLAHELGGSGGGHAKAAAGRVPVGEDGDIDAALLRIEQAIKEIFVDNFDEGECEVTALL